MTSNNSVANKTGAYIIQTCLTGNHPPQFPDFAILV